MPKKEFGLMYHNTHPIDGMFLFSMFRPFSSKHIYRDFPELKEKEELTRLIGEDVVFCWYMGCKMSPVYQKHSGEAKKMVKEVIDLAYGEDFKTKKPKDYSLLMELSFSSNIKAAIEVFKSFEPSPRIMAKFTVEKMMKNMFQMANVDVTDEEQFKNKDKEVDWAKKGAFINTMAKINETLPKLIDHAEKGFGIEVKGIETLDVSYDIAEEYMKNKG